MVCEHKLELCMICLNTLRDKVKTVERINADMQIQIFKYNQLQILFRSAFTPGKSPQYTPAETWEKYREIIGGYNGKSSTEPQ